MTWEIAYVCISATWASVAAWGIFALWSNFRYSARQHLGSNR